MTTDGKLLAQDDIDALLGEAGLEGNYNDEPVKKAEPSRVKKSSAIRYTSRSDLDVKGAVGILYSKAMLERDNEVKVIWNAAGTIPMLTGVNMKIDNIDYISLGTLYKNHLVVKNNP